MKIVNCFLIFSILLKLNCYSPSRHLKPMIHKDFSDKIIVEVISDIREIKINRYWSQKSYLKLSSLNSYSIYIHTEEFKKFLEDRLREKLAESVITKEDKARVEVRLKEISYSIEKEITLFSPEKKIFPTILISASIFMDGERREFAHEINTPNRSVIEGYPLLVWFPFSSLARLAGIKLSLSLLSGSIFTGMLFYSTNSKDNIENFLSEDLNRFAYSLRDRLESIKKEKKSDLPE
jgi:hypothetical protein